MRKHTAAHFTAILFILTAIMTGCDKKEQKQNPFHTQQSQQQTETLTKEKLQASKNRLEDNTTTLYPSTGEMYALNSLTGEQKHVAIDGTRVVFKDISQPVVLVYFFTPWSLPCQGEIPYLSQLQKKYANDLYVLGILLNPKKYTQDISSFIQNYHANFYISISDQNNPLAQKLFEPLNIPESVPVPMMVIYRSGHYWRHYEGAVPIEMIEHDLKTILE